ncbi:MAG: hypothetical protein J7M39_11715 [Anaerolineae bacterium]|nr:hypothetical protein [Anaerolineae bacterium]
MNPCKTTRLYALAIVWVVLVLVASACAQARPTSTPEANTVSPETVALPVSQEEPTDTPEPTPDPTDTPQPVMQAEDSVPATETLTPQAEQAAVSVPPGNPPSIDGTLSAGEWGDAAIELLSDGSELLLMHAEGYLYLGIRSTTREGSATNIYVEDDDQVRILHASAALGTAITQQGTDNWQQTREFDWKCRGSSNSEAAVAARAAYLRDEGWVVGISPMGTPNELEYQIELMSTLRRIAVSAARSSSPDERVFWPATLDDDCIKPTPGGMPPELHLSPAQWAEIDLSL